MQTKSTKDMQNELEFMRRAYQERHENLNKYLGEVPLSRHPMTWLLIATLTIPSIAAAIALLCK